MMHLPDFGFGTTQFWYGDDRNSFACMEKAVKEYGITMIDTAEMYGSGECEKAVGKLIRKAGRDSLTIVDKILPENAHQRNFFRSLERSLRLLGTDYIDLYLLHWREDADLEEMSSLMEQAKAQGKILHWGVSNFDVHDMEELLACPDGKYCEVNQVLYNILHRGIEFDLQPFCTEKQIALMAYNSLDLSRMRSQLKKIPEIQEILKKEAVSIEGLMLEFVRSHGICALFQTASIDHLDDDLRNTGFDYSQYSNIIDSLYPAPSHRIPLEKR